MVVDVFKGFINKINQKKSKNNIDDLLLAEPKDTIKSLQEEREEKIREIEEYNARLAKEKIKSSIR